MARPARTCRLRALETLWFNTGTLCNLACANCYIESTPRNDALVYLSAAEVATFLDEVASAAAADAHDRLHRRRAVPQPRPPGDGGRRARPRPSRARPHQRHAPDAASRGRPCWSFASASVTGSSCASASTTTPRRSTRRSAARALGRSPATAWSGWRATASTSPSPGVTSPARARARPAPATPGCSRTSAISLDAADPAALVLFPEMDPVADIPEITEACWSLLGLDPHSIMCATSRMVEKRKGAAAPHVVACTLIPYDPGFALGPTLEGSRRARRAQPPQLRPLLRARRRQLRPLRPIERRRPSKQRRLKAEAWPGQAARASTISAGTVPMERSRRGSA